MSNEIVWAIVGAVVGGAVVYAAIELTKEVPPAARLYDVDGARWGPYMHRISSGARGLGMTVQNGRVSVGPYAGGVVAPKFIPGVLTPKFTHGA